LGYIKGITLWQKNPIFPSISPTPDQINFSASLQQINIKQSMGTLKFLSFAAILLVVLQPISARWCKHDLLYCGQYLLDDKGKQHGPPHHFLDIADLKQDIPERIFSLPFPQDMWQENTWSCISTAAWTRTTTSYTLVFANTVVASMEARVIMTIVSPHVLALVALRRMQK
jgi:hypothetical protein